MTSTFKLVKIFFKERFLNGKRKQRTSKKTNPIIGILIIIGLILFYAYTFTQSFKMIFDTQKLFIDNYNKVLYTIVGLTNISSLFFIILSGNTLLFSKADESVLGPLPINEKKVVLAKLIIAYASDSFFSLLIGVCGTIAYCLSGDISFVGIIVVFFAPILAGVLPLCLLSFVIIGLKRLIAKSKARRAFELIGLGLSIMFIVAFSSLVSISSSSYDQESVMITGNIYGIIITYYPLLILVKMALDFNNILYFIYYVLALGLILFVFINLFTKHAYKLMLEPTNKYKGKKTKVTYSLNDFNKIVLRKEFKKTFSSNIILLNTLTMPILFAILFIIFSLSIPMKDINLSMVVSSLDINLNIIQLMAVYFVLAGVPSLFFPSFSLSIESKSMWIMLTLPINTNDYLKIKRYYNYIWQLGTILITTIIYLVFGKFDILFIMCLIVFGLSIALFTTNIYQLINLKHPSIGQDEGAIVKQSKASFISTMVIMLFAFGTPFLGIILIVLLKSICITLLIISAILIIIVYFINKKIKIDGERLLKNFC